MGNTVDEKVKIANTYLQSSIESYKDVLIFSVDRNYNYLFFNTSFKAATHHAYGTVVEMGKSMLESITSEQDRVKAKKNCDKALEGEGHTTVEIYGDLNKSYFETKYNPIINELGKIIGVTVMSANVTDRKLAEERIVALNKELEAFSYSVAHDLRAPLRIIDGYVAMLVEEHQQKLDSECQRLLNVISASARQMSQLIDGLLNFSRLGRQVVEKKMISTGPLLGSIISEHRNGLDKSRIEIKTGNLEDLYCDEKLIRHVFANLVSNAIKYSMKKEKALIEIGSTRADKGVVYYVKDNGAGFDMKYAGKLFNVFERLHRNDEFEGTGVGLAIVQRIISKHGGRIWAEAEVDKGAAFYFYLPE